MCVRERLLTHHNGVLSHRLQQHLQTLFGEAGCSGGWVGHDSVVLIHRLQQQHLQSLREEAGCSGGWVMALLLSADAAAPADQASPQRRQIQQGDEAAALACHAPRPRCTSHCIHATHSRPHAALLAALPCLPTCLLILPMFCDSCISRFMLQKVSSVRSTWLHQAAGSR